ncbi:MAG: BatB [Candidatus Ozemobacter sibiricus]|jgi:Ca-activated chloride channel family protein|uniref:BatB n=1 Tax=Candidatus Ozemobacter sibiricus TaxID=2268124 RepID=A0A367ZQV2_9BACT|nr:MAG: BatB [Candidatus Ozemobacter sibiricus]
MFREPWVLGLLAFTLVWAILLVRVMMLDLRRRRAAFAAAPMLHRITGHQPTRRPVVKWGLMLLALACFGLALARPQGGFVEETVIGQALDLVVALDVSQSMLAPDVSGNTRLDVAKALVAHLVNYLKQDRLGLVVFAGDTMVQSPLSLDKNAFLTFLERTDPSLLTKQGTNLAAAIETSLDRFDFTASQARVILLISDGEDHDKERLDRAIAEAKRKRVPVHTIGIGSKEGSYLPVGRDVWGRVIYKTWQGERVVTRLDDRMLRRIAQETGGRFFRASDMATAREVAAGLEALPRAAIAGGSQLTTRELFSWPLLAGFLLLLLEWMISERIPYEREKDHWLKRI